MLATVALSLAARWVFAVEALLDAKVEAGGDDVCFTSVSEELRGCARTRGELGVGLLRMIRGGLAMSSLAWTSIIQLQPLKAEDLDLPVISESIRVSKKKGKNGTSRACAMVIIIDKDSSERRSVLLDMT